MTDLDIQVYLKIASNDPLLRVEVLNCLMDRLITAKQRTEADYPDAKITIDWEAVR
jgi:hypothetical protein